MIQELMTNIKTLPPINSTINFGNSLYNEIYDVVKSTIPSFLILTVADVASNKLNHQSYTLSIGTHLIKTKIALQFLTTAFLYISNVQNTEELAS